ncbi:hypothetical protein QWZ08_08850 [Ferruginibacter paludis]|uniref:hypothetical protein n=1 Tax=Ferruginibacter paludis TaxID=1310417 RepID=UPI0025B3575A|nr:hypothetical protein [Ferruginibacter paludis]MDN3655732.1 hypothetical protein [Ferruginibacter paludis]
MKRILLITMLFTSLQKTMAQQNRWALANGNTIQWTVSDRLPHQDHIEMSGKFISAVIHYGVNADQSFFINRDIVWPMLRTIPNNTHASLIRSFNIDPVKMIVVNKKQIQAEKVTTISLNGTLVVKSTLNEHLELTRTIFPSTGLPVFCEQYQLLNKDEKPATVEIPLLNIKTATNAADGVEGSYDVMVQTKNAATIQLQPRQSYTFYLYFSAIKKGQDYSNTEVADELVKRNELLSLLNDNLVLETPDSVLNRAFAFAKIRAAESIYQTKGGPMHGPGGLSYYAAIWANDQAEYINPFFPYLGYDYGIESALNAYRHFARFMNADYRPIPSSIVAEGTDIWNGAGDRGDAAMIAYGASRFALSQGDKKMATELWPLIEWCLEYNKRKLNAAGVVASESDELEGRFPSGKANLNTSSLYYDALISAAYLGEALQKDKKQIAVYKSAAINLKRNINTYFAANVMGYDTYRYYEGNDKLRSWICTPLTVGIFDRKQGTIDALFSPQLWTDDGLASQAGDKTFWDRSTLYALRGLFAAGDTKRGLQYLQYYSNRRLLGEHVPYPVEAYPEGNQRHLSAESGLYCRIYTEGLFGIRPIDLNAFTITPQLPAEWNFMQLKHVHGYQNTFDIEARREGSQLRLKVSAATGIVFNKLVLNGSKQTIRF